MRIALHVDVTEDERGVLMRWAHGRRTPARLILRAKIILLAAAGHETRDITTQLGTSRQTVGLWRHRSHVLPGVRWADEEVQIGIASWPSNSTLKRL